MVIVGEPILFQWDEGNREKSLKKHGVSIQECEEAFADSRKSTVPDLLHSESEKRFMLFGATNQNRVLTIVFTLREGYVRVISARGANQKEHNLYHAHTKKR